MKKLRAKMKNDIARLDLLMAIDYEVSKNTRGDLGSLILKFTF